MLCDKCHKREAKIYCTEIVNGEKKEQYLCEQCAADYASFQVGAEDEKKEAHENSLLSGLLEKGYQNQEDAMEVIPKCEGCGMRYKEFLKTGKFGCPSCYDAFGQFFEKSLKQIQGADTHFGKVPKGYVTSADRAIDLIPEIDKLNLKLQYAIEKEQYEEAARIRDRIRELQNMNSKNTQEGMDNA
ncbi:MAG: UvrB/UvrC motif-containing protein [Clostridium sp.]|nr:UvrB/UvrC motif-containing protein [Clostridium sp.]